VGEDVMLSPKARAIFPYSIECKNVEKLNLWEAWKQAEANAGGYEPLLIVKRNRQKPLVVVDAEHFIGVLNEDDSASLRQGIYGSVLFPHQIPHL